MKNKIGLVIIGIIILIGIIPGLGIYDFVSAGNVGVVTRFGAVNRVAYPGVVFKLPLIEWVTSMNTRTQKDQQEASAASSDLQTVDSSIAVNYHLEAPDAVTVYQNIGTTYQDTVVSPLIQEVFKSVTAKYTASELITKRDLVRVEAQNELTNKLQPYHIQVDNFNIVNFSFSADFSQAIEQKQVAQQNLQRAQIEAQTAVTQAQGQAKAQAVLKDNGSLTPEYLQFLAVQKWDGVLPKATSGTPFLNIPSQ